MELGSKRLDTFNLALRRSNLPPLKLPAPPAFVKLTPAAPVSGTAKIVRVGASIYRGPDPTYPDGVFAIDPHGYPQSSGPNLLGGLDEFQRAFRTLDDVPTGLLELQFLAEGGALYIVDCRASTASAVPYNTVVFSRSGSTATQSVTSDAGHFIYAFRAQAGTRINQSVSLKFNGPAYFYGCEITKTS